MHVITKSVFLSKNLLVNLLRQKTIVFSCFILPVVTLISIWWITADIPMTFSLHDGTKISASMLDVHVITGGLTAMAITAGIFSFVITAEYQKIAKRLRLTGYSPRTINIAVMMALLSFLIIASIATTILTILLYEPKEMLGMYLAVILTTLIYAAVGNLIGNLYPKMMEGTLIVLLASFIDLMLLSNPMGEELYLQSWTYYVSGFWPTQLVLDAAFIGSPIENNLTPILYSILYALILFALVQLTKVKIKERMRSLTVGERQ